MEVLTSNNKECSKNNYPYDRQGAAGRDRVDLWGGACLRLAVYVPYSVLAMARSGEQRDFVVYSNGGSPLTTHRAFRIRFVLNRCDPNLNKKLIYSCVSNFRKTSSALKWKPLCWRRTDTGPVNAVNTTDNIVLYKLIQKCLCRSARKLAVALRLFDRSVSIELEVSCIEIGKFISTILCWFKNWMVEVEKFYQIFCHDMLRNVYLEDGIFFLARHIYIYNHQTTLIKVLISKHHPGTPPSTTPQP